MAKILIVDDESSLLASLRGYLSLRGHEVLTSQSAEGGLEIIRRQDPEIVLLDVFLAGRDGVEVLESIAARGAATRVIMISGHADIPTAVRALRAGAFDFLEKPIDTDRLDILLAKLSEELALRRGMQRLRSLWREENLFVGSSVAMRRAVDIARRAAASELSILITGENGTGKEVLARLIHTTSGRVSGPFVAVNCAALPAELVESALFGHRKGSFTEAVADRDGFFSAANGGTLFLDEICDLPIALQPKLLRVLENHEIQRIGSTDAERVDARIICATNRSLPDAIAGHVFREDLYYRLNQLTVRVPALRERREDIRGLVGFLLRGRKLRFSEEAFRYLEDRDWPGNVRELGNLVERVAVLATTDPVSESDVRVIDTRFTDSPEAEHAASGSMTLAEAKKRFERRFVEARLAAHGWSVKEAAKDLGILPNNLSRKIAELGIRAPAN